MKVVIGIDVGSVSTNLVALSTDRNVLSSIYLRTHGEPIKAVQQGLAELRRQLPAQVEVAGVGTTGSGRQLAAVMVGGDVVKNEITAHAVAALQECPNVKTVLEIGGQDSKIIIIRRGIVVDFAMNTVCAAGTGSFLDRQAARLGLDIGELGPLALKSQNPTRIAGRCAVFAESDMIHKQQMGYSTPDIVKGLCQALVRNYLNNVGKGKEIQAPVVFQGGVAANVGIKQCFEEELGLELTVPRYFNVMGAYGAALLALEQVGSKGTAFRGFEIADLACRTTSTICSGCGNRCEVINFEVDGKLVARWGDRCGRWSQAAHAAST